MSERILCLEGHEDSLELLKLLLEREGYEVVGARTPEEAERAGAESEFHLFLIDSRVFEKALGLCRTLRAAHPTVPIIFYSGHAQPKDQEAAIRAGAQAYLIKPHDFGKIASEVALWIERSTRKEREG